MRTFGQMFPESVNTLRAKHYRVFLLKTSFLKYYYSLRAPSHLIDQGKLLEGSIPIIINNFNRLETLKVLMDWISSLSTPTSILVLDNDSTYKPLLEFYKKIEDGDTDNIQIIRFDYNNELRKILPMSMVLRRFEKYVVTDADLIPYPNTPNDILDKMSDLLDRHPEVNHVGPSLEINDIPNCYPLRDDVLEWESQFWAKRHCPNTFKAEVDTTMGMYRKGSLVTRVNPALRLDRPYTLKHVDWYIDPESMSKEHKYYLEHCTAVSTWNTKLKHHDS